MESKWKNKKVLVIGDSITADGRWQAEVARLTGAEISTHAYGGIGLIDMVMGLGASENEDMKYDPYTGCNGNFKPLTVDEVGCADLIILLGAYNERHMEYGVRGDMYPRQNTLRGICALLRRGKRLPGGSYGTDGNTRLPALYGALSSFREARLQDSSAHRLGNKGAKEQDI